MTRIWRLRAAILLLLGGIVVHQGRYLLAPPDHTHSGIHAYLAWLGPAILLGVLVLGVEFGARVLGNRGDRFQLPPAGVLFPVFAIVLLTLFGMQETIEMTIADGVIPTENVFLAAGAWVATPLALFVAGLLTLLLRGAATIMQAVAARAARTQPRPERVAAPPTQVSRPRSALLAFSLAPRGPPVLS